MGGRARAQDLQERPDVQVPGGAEGDELQGGGHARSQRVQHQRPEGQRRLRSLRGQRRPRAAHQAAPPPRPHEQPGREAAAQRALLLALAHGARAVLAGRERRGRAHARLADQLPAARSARGGRPAHAARLLLVPRHRDQRVRRLLVQEQAGERLRLRQLGALRRAHQRGDVLGDQRDTARVHAAQAHAHHQALHTDRPGVQGVQELQLALRHPQRSRPPQRHAPQGDLGPRLGQVQEDLARSQATPRSLLQHAQVSPDGQERTHPAANCKPQILFGYIHN